MEETLTLTMSSPSSPSPSTSTMAIVPCATLALPSPSSRRLPPPCWTPDETLTLINAYRDKWYSLRRSNLRAAHWQEVADEIHRRCPNVSPAKTAIQCRHKMEKLRKRYRSDLQRAKGLPNHRFSSSWQFFFMMDEMEKGPTIATASIAVDEDDDGIPDDDDGDEGYALMNNHRDSGLRIKIQPNPNPSFGNSGLPAKNLNENPNPRYGNSGIRSFNNFDENPNPSYGNSGLQSKNNFDQIPYPNPSYGNSGFRSQRKFDENPNPIYGNSGFGSKKNFTDFEDYKPKYTSINSFASLPQSDEAARYSSRVGNDNVNSIPTMRNKEKKGGLGKRDRVREEEATLEMVDAIRTLGEGFVRMEKMKMEVMRETERMKMEMEMKRTQMILESQHRIVEAIATGLADSSKVDKDASC